MWEQITAALRAAFGREPVNTSSVVDYRRGEDLLNPTISSLTGNPITVADAKRIAEVGQSLRLIGGTIATLPVRALAGDGTEAGQQPAIVRKLNGRAGRYFTGHKLRRWASDAVLLQGRAMIHLDRNNNGLLMNLDPCIGGPAAQLESGTPVYRLYRIGDGREIIADAGDVLHLTGDASLNGEGVLTGSAANAVAILHAVETYTGAFFHRGAFQTSVITSEKVGTTQDRLDKIAERFKDRFGKGLEALGMPIVLDAGMRLEKVSADAREIALPEVQQLASLRTAAAFGVAPILLGVQGEGSNGPQTMEDANDHLQRYTVTPLLSSWEAEILAKTNVHVDFDHRYITRLGTKNRYAAHRLALGEPGKPGFMSTNEVRKLEGLKPDPNPSSNRINDGSQQPLDGGEGDGEGNDE